MAMANHSKIHEAQITNEKKILSSTWKNSKQLFGFGVDI